MVFYFLINIENRRIVPTRDLLWHFRPRKIDCKLTGEYVIKIKVTSYETQDASELHSSDVTRVAIINRKR